jgi:hypothetical protein
MLVNLNPPKDPHQEETHGKGSSRQGRAAGKEDTHDSAEDPRPKVRILLNYRLAQ